MTRPSLPVELARAVTGVELPVGASDPSTLVIELTQLGWGRERLAEVRSQRMAERQPWPFPVSLEARRGLGFARFDAALSDLRAAVGLAGVVSQPQARSRPLTADERRLVADKPPHWG